MLHTTQWGAFLAQSYLRSGKPARGRLHLAAARAHCERYGENYLAAELYRLEALFLRSQGASAGTIEQHLGTAVSIAHEQGARLLELRSATMLAQLWAEHGERQRACDLPTAVYASFTEGLNTDDLQQAAILLNQLD